MLGRCLHCRRQGTSRNFRRGLCSTCKRTRDVYDQYTPRCGTRTPTGAAGRPWTRGEASDLWIMYTEGWSDQGIGIALGRTVGSVTKKRQDMGLAVSKAVENEHRRMTWEGKDRPEKVVVVAATALVSCAAML